MRRLAYSVQFSIELFCRAWTPGLSPAGLFGTEGLAKAAVERGWRPVRESRLSTGAVKSVRRFLWQLLRTF